MVKSKISVGALGGTICMSSDGKDSGVKPKFSAKDLISAVPGIEKLADLSAKTLLSVASGSIKIKDLIDVYKWAKNEVKNGASGIVVTQGTDTLEESSFFMDLIWDEDIPFIMTGAMRNPDEISADGPANIEASILTALDKNSKNRGVLVVLNNTIHSAKWVHKTNTFSLETFMSINAGIQGKVIEGSVEYINFPVKREIFRCPKTGDIPQIAIIESALGDDATMIQLIKNSPFEGLIISSYGAGHVSIDMMKGLEDLEIPVIIASRTGSGKTATKTYGYYGSETTLQDNGCVMSGWLSPYKARILLIILMANKIEKAKIKKIFANF